MSVQIPEGYVYLDWAATAPLCQEALDAMAPYLVAGPEAVLHDANANSLHSPGRSAFERMEQARRRFAHAIGASRPNEVVFTGGATEADNAALAGLAAAQVQLRTQKGHACDKPRIVTTRIEHEAVLQSAERLARELCPVVRGRAEERPRFFRGQAAVGLDRGKDDLSDV